MRKKEEIQKIFAMFQQHHIADFGAHLNVVHMEQVLHKMLLKRLEAFVARRIGHLPDSDLLTLCEVFKEAYAEKQETKRKSRS